MKRELIQNVKVQPYTSAAVIDRFGFQSGILAVKVGTPTGSPTGLAVKLTLTECDTADGTFVAVADEAAVIDKPLDSTGSVSVETDAAGGGLVNFDIDLVGCKPFIKATVEMVCTGGTNPSCSATAALALGDSYAQPV